MRKKIVVVIVVLLVAVQMARPARNQSNDRTKDITTQYAIPDNVQLILKEACYDCHSNYTYYPWYSNIQPVAWWLQHHVNEGKGELNFSEFAGYSAKKQAHKLKEVAGIVADNEMPLSSYTWIHKKARLTEEQKQMLIGWARSLQQEIITKNQLPQNNNQ